MGEIHRWQPSLVSPCGRELDSVAYNEGQMLDDGVTCPACRQNPSRMSLLPPRPHPTKEPTSKS